MLQSSCNEYNFFEDQVTYPACPKVKYFLKAVSEIEHKITVSHYTNLNLSSSIIIRRITEFTNPKFSLTNLKGKLKMKHILLVITLAFFYSSPSIATSKGESYGGLQYALVTYDEDGFDEVEPTALVGR